MANPPYFDRNSMMHHPPDSSGPRYLNGSNVTEPDSQWPVFHQTTSSPMLRGYNQPPCSFSASLELPASLHQAESQSCPRITRNPSTSSSYAQFPVNNSMRRSISQFSSMSSSQHAHGYNMTQAPRGSFDGSLPLEMTRSYSSTSDNPETANQSPSVHLALTPADWHTGQQFAFTPEGLNQCTTTGPSTQYQYELDDNFGIGNGSGDQSLEWKTHTNNYRPSNMPNYDSYLGIQLNYALLPFPMDALGRTWAYEYPCCGLHHGPNISYQDHYFPSQSSLDYTMALDQISPLAVFSDLRPYTWPSTE
ncbi:hypothetical protein COCMIDRAFT_22569 [Bipolaris oryzae ATCC 44560]|uniref:Uncharacterized protein n=1 Tax=Bipolaris oryzae ATCC 44560 TaxID=930090 RepID=W7A155_COCMI|nr:uncharacterized protein COCMIDRAFT_22569 [Bipolaris oryzae ATCC 44560]EUC49791.1 hypothetical protein COCMIDRAFT_22569 [Bipolaris oryzae ATCC 44560]